jgi:hypothetical protein
VLIRTRRPRDGRNIGPFDLVYALQDAYQIDTKLSHVLAIGGFGLIHADTLTELPAAPPNPIKEFKAFLSAVEHAFVPKKLQREAVRLRDYARSFLSHRTMDLHYIGLHGHIEHDASITHDDAPLPTSDFARWASNTSLFDAFMADAPGSHVDLATISAARVRREAETQLWSGRTLDGLHADIARGEAALVIGILGETLPDAPAGVSHVGTQWDWAGLGVHKDVMRTFWQEERLPAGWKPLRVTSAQSTDKGKKIITAHMDKLRAAQAARANTTTYFVDGAQAVLA